MRCSGSREGEGNDPHPAPDGNLGADHHDAHTMELSGHGGGVCAYGKQEQTMVSMSSYLFPPSRLDSGSLGRNKGRFSAGEAGALLAKREQLLLEKDEFEKYARHQLEICRRLEETDGRG